MFKHPFIEVTNIFTAREQYVNFNYINHLIPAFSYSEDDEEDEFCEIILTNGESLKVNETVEEIKNKIEALNRG